MENTPIRRGCCIGGSWHRKSRRLVIREPPHERPAAADRISRPETEQGRSLGRLAPRFGGCRVRPSAQAALERGSVARPRVESTAAGLRPGVGGGPNGLRSVEAAHRHVDFCWLEERLVPLGFRLIYCRRNPENFASARTKRLKVSANPAQYEDLNRFIQEQALMDQPVDQSILPRYDLDISDNDLPAAAERAVAWLKATGALYYPGSK